MQLPGPVRAVVGLVASAADEARHLPDRAVELPMLAVSSALQLSLRAQQRYARLAARGDDVLNRRATGDEAPSWATFDEPVSPEELRAASMGDADPALRARAASHLLDQLLGMSEEPPSGANATNGSAPAAAGSEDADVVDFPTAQATSGSPARRPAKKTGRRAAAKKKSAPAESAPAKRAAGPAAAKKTAAKKPVTQPVKKAPASAKTISRPRHGDPSPFDTVDDE